MLRVIKMMMPTYISIVQGPGGLLKNEKPRNQDSIRWASEERKSKVCSNGLPCGKTKIYNFSRFSKNQDS
ncbi:hypothetical protein RirG_212140 [Rhizophagus irregularis DAOM 197198w]|uniref:Uncharacterized protein n=1 Tax=Rhizophagus irregularis (strain DAOM 197198w) TaxID=1432141 RepID=A0A015JPG6_RHIIW|nr:hypothetical protein RirG_212140 [Rhizophagus irregularis DAOM 197198w]